MDMVDLLGHSVGLTIWDATIYVSMQNENTGELMLAEKITPKFTPRSKHYETKTIWFHEENLKKRIKLVNIDTLHQLGQFYERIARGNVRIPRKEIDGVMKLVNYVLES